MGEEGGLKASAVAAGAPRRLLIGALDKTIGPREQQLAFMPYHIFGPPCVGTKTPSRSRYRAHGLLDGLAKHSYRAKHKSCGGLARLRIQNLWLPAGNLASSLMPRKPFPGPRCPG